VAKNTASFLLIKEAAYEPEKGEAGMKLIWGLLSSGGDLLQHTARTAMNQPTISSRSSALFHPVRTWFTRLSNGWYRWTSFPDPTPPASFQLREKARKSRLLSSIVGFLLCIFLGFVPACLELSNHYVLAADTSMLPICVLALLLGKQGKITAGGMLLALSFEIALTIVIATTSPFDEASIQQYELFAFGELLAVSLLSPTSVFGMALYNTLVISWSLFLQMQTPEMVMVVHEQGLPLWARPVAVQWLIAGVTYLWVRNATSANRHADQVEVAVYLEHERVEQERARAAERVELMEGLNHLIRHHVRLIHHPTVEDLHTPIPLPSCPPLLWPLVNVLNRQHHRLVQARQNEEELQRLRHAILWHAEQLEHDRRESLACRSGTMLDVLLSQLVRHWDLPASGGAKPRGASSPPARKEEP
jgi:hypothetical protein